MAGSEVVMRVAAIVLVLVSGVAFGDEPQFPPGCRSAGDKLHPSYMVCDEPRKPEKPPTPKELQIALSAQICGGLRDMAAAERETKRYAAAIVPVGLRNRAKENGLGTVWSDAEEAVKTARKRLADEKMKPLPCRGLVAKVAICLAFTDERECSDEGARYAGIARAQ
jgi:hypothetical protein